MRRKHKTYFFLAAIISLIIPIASVFIYYSNLTEADVPSPGLCFVNPDQDDPWAGDKDESRILGLTASSETLLLEGNLLKKVPHPFSQTPSFDLKTINLRC